MRNLFKDRDARYLAEMACGLANRAHAKIDECLNRMAALEEITSANHKPLIDRETGIVVHPCGRRVVRAEELLDRIEELYTLLDVERREVSGKPAGHVLAKAGVRSKKAKE